MQLIFKPEKQGRVCSTAESRNYYEYKPPSCQHKPSDSPTQPTGSAFYSLLFMTSRILPIEMEISRTNLNTTSNHFNAIKKEFIYIVALFLGQTGKVSRKQNNCEWRVFPEPSLTFGRQNGKEQHLYFLHIMLLSGSQRIKKEIHTCCVAQKYISEVLSWFYQHSAAGNSNSIPDGTNKILIWHSGSWIHLFNFLLHRSEVCQKDSSPNLSEIRHVT